MMTFRDHLDATPRLGTLVPGWAQRAGAVLGDLQVSHVRVFSENGHLRRYQILGPGYLLTHRRNGFLMVGVSVRKLEIYEVGDHWSAQAIFSSSEMPIRDETRLQPKRLHVGYPSSDEESLGYEFVTSGDLSDVAALVQPALPASYPPPHTWEQW